MRVRVRVPLAPRCVAAISFLFKNVACPKVGAKSRAQTYYVSLINSRNYVLLIMAAFPPDLPFSAFIGCHYFSPATRSLSHTFTSLPAEAMHMQYTEVNS